MVTAPGSQPGCKPGHTHPHGHLHRICSSLQAAAGAAAAEAAAAAAAAAGCVQMSPEHHQLSGGPSGQQHAGGRTETAWQSRVWTSSWVGELEG